MNNGDSWLTFINDRAEQGDSSQPARPVAVESDEELLDAYSRAVIHVVEKVGPAVVSIRVKKAGGSPRSGDEGVGSGLSIAPDGFVLTNNHVVEGAGEVK